ncbi:MAG: hypothetical protein JWM53_2102 [bacterium]|nr:hypothetical protein [bacterium]
MARILFFVVAALTTAGCGDDTTTASADLATAVDLAVPNDLTSLGCGAILACVAGCGQNLVCQVGCRDAGTTMGKSVYGALIGCTTSTCAPGDAGSGACMNATDNSPACLTCLANAATQAVNPTGACHAEYLACAGS